VALLVKTSADMEVGKPGSTSKASSEDSAIHNEAVCAFLENVTSEALNLNTEG